MVSRKFNLSPEVSQQLVDFIVAQVKGTLPRAFRSMLTDSWPEVPKPKASWTS
jgi:hypothetical protein